jgi:hypothetical protein
LVPEREIKLESKQELESPLGLEINSEDSAPRPSPRVTEVKSEADTYLETATQAAELIISKYKSSKSAWQFSLVDGALGCAYALLYLCRASPSDKTKRYEETAKQIFQDSRAIFSEANLIQDILGDTTGFEYRNELSILLAAHIDCQRNIFCFPFLEEMDANMLDPFQE